MMILGAKSQPKGELSFLTDFPGFFKKAFARRDRP